MTRSLFVFAVFGRLNFQFILLWSVAGIEIVLMHLYDNIEQIVKTFTPKNPYISYE